MHPAVLQALRCPSCLHSSLAEVPSSLQCGNCGQAFPMEAGVAVLGDREEIVRFADRWPGGLSEASLRSAISARRAAYESDATFRAWIDRAATQTGVIVDIATGPGSSLLGPLLPLLSMDVHVAATDASLPLLKQLHDLWRQETRATTLDFLACNANGLPFGDGSVDVVTSFLGMGNVWDDPERQKPPRFGQAYREARRIVRPGGRVYDLAIFFAEESETARLLADQGCVAATQEGFESFLTTLGFQIEGAEKLWPRQGKSHPGDMVPIGEDDAWWHMAYALCRV